jgi:type VI protein secretion system component VasA
LCFRIFPARYSAPPSFLLVHDNHSQNVNLLRRGLDLFSNARLRVEDITTTTNVADVCQGVLAECLSQLLDALAERTVRHCSPLPHVLDEFVFADEAAPVFDQIFEHLIGLWAQVNKFIATQ